MSDNYCTVNLKFCLPSNIRIRNATHIIIRNTGERPQTERAENLIRKILEQASSNLQDVAIRTRDVSADQALSLLEKTPLSEIHPGIEDSLINKVTSRTAVNNLGRSSLSSSGANRFVRTNILRFLSPEAVDKLVGPQLGLQEITKLAETAPLAGIKTETVNKLANRCEKVLALENIVFNAPLNDINRAAMNRLANEHISADARNRLIAEGPLHFLTTDAVQRLIKKEGLTAENNNKLIRKVGNGVLNKNMINKFLQQELTPEAASRLIQDALALEEDDLDKSALVGQIDRLAQSGDVAKQEVACEKLPQFLDKYRFGKFEDKDFTKVFKAAIVAAKRGRGDALVRLLSEKNPYFGVELKEKKKKTFSDEAQKALCDLEIEQLALPSWQKAVLQEAQNKVKKYYGKKEQIAQRYDARTAKQMERIAYITARTGVTEEDGRRELAKRGKQSKVLTIIPDTPGFRMHQAAKENLQDTISVKRAILGKLTLREKVAFYRGKTPAMPSVPEGQSAGANSPLYPPPPAITGDAYTGDPGSYPDLTNFPSPPGSVGKPPSSSGIEIGKMPRDMAELDLEERQKRYDLADREQDYAYLQSLVQSAGKQGIEVTKAARKFESAMQETYQLGAMLETGGIVDNNIRTWAQGFFTGIVQAGLENAIPGIGGMLGKVAGQAINEAFKRQTAQKLGRFEAFGNATNAEGVSCTSDSEQKHRALEVFHQVAICLGLHLAEKLKKDPIYDKTAYEKLTLYFSRAVKGVMETEGRDKGTYSVADMALFTLEKVLTKNWDIVGEQSPQSIKEEAARLYKKYLEKSVTRQAFLKQGILPFSKQHNYGKKTMTQSQIWTGNKQDGTPKSIKLHAMRHVTAMNSPRYVPSDRRAGTAI